MSWWEYAIPGYGAYKAISSAAENWNTPSRSGGEYGGVDKGNFDLPGAKERSKRLLDMAQGFGQRQAPGIGRFQNSGEGEFRGGQEALIRQLQGRASGADSLSQIQLRQAADHNLAQQQALAASARPGQGAMAARMASQQAGNIGQGLAGQAAQAGIMERAQAQDMLGNVLAGARGQDIGQSQFNANTQNQRLLEMARMQQQQYGMNDQALLEALRQEQANAALRQQGTMGYEGQRTQRYGAAMGTPTYGEQILGGLSSAGAAFAGGM